jgi:hypothetical protein
MLRSAAFAKRINDYRFSDRGHGDGDLAATGQRGGTYSLATKSQPIGARLDAPKKNRSGQEPEWTQSTTACRGLTRAVRHHWRVLATVVLALSAQGCASPSSLSPGTAIDNATREKLAAAAQAAGDPDGALTLLGNAAAHDPDPVLRMQ